MTDGRLTPAVPAPLDGGEVFRGGEAGSVLDFWRCAMPDLRTNTTRGLLAEFLVHRAVGATVRNPAHSHADYDPLDVARWSFFVASRASVAANGRNSAGLATVRRLCGEPVGYGELAGRIFAV
ncbi:hypothetical protein ACIQF6_05960 [Kitasatospora sp. NPDC092948]|uniref:hypothetical protein n=1 Tax=Kitasatospora sp. NPDC092948 TaxID=3364088 RepID=UPI0037F87020